MYTHAHDGKCGVSERETQRKDRKNESVYVCVKERKKETVGQRREADDDDDDDDDDDAPATKPCGVRPCPAPSPTHLVPGL